MESQVPSSFQQTQPRMDGLAAEASAPVRHDPARSNVARRKIAVVECARGFAASYVFVYHVFSAADAFKLFSWGKYAFHFLGYGHQAVLLFFLLSGFSIHYSSRDRGLSTWAECLDYFYLRFRRIYPLFLCAVGLTLVLILIGGALHLTPDGPNLSQFRPVPLLATLTFLTDLDRGGQWFTVLSANSPLWSLSYEIPYYLVYPLFLCGAKVFGIGRVFLASVFISALAAAIDLAGIHNHLSNVFSLYWLWCAGALIAEWRANGRTIEISANYLYCIIFMLFACTQLVEKDAARIVTDWVWGLFLAVVMAGYQTRCMRGTIGGRMAGIARLGVMMAIMVALAQTLPLSGSRKLLDGRIVAAAGVMALFIAGYLGLFTFCTAILRPFYKVGAWSYALYITHYPILVFVTAVLMKLHWPKGLLVLSAPAIVWFARRLELQFQPAVARLMDATVRPALKSRLVPAA
jgi:peptidoglycan/LPS O-acetylase OafA/YrhL